MRSTPLILILPAVLALAACGQSRQDVAESQAKTGQDGAVVSGPATAGNGMTTTPPNGTAVPQEDQVNIPQQDPMANPGVPGGDLNMGAGNSNTGPGNDGSAGTLPSGTSNETPSPQPK